MGLYRDREVRRRPARLRCWFHRLLRSPEWPWSIRILSTRNSTIWSRKAWLIKVEYSRTTFRSCFVFRRKNLWPLCCWSSMGVVGQHTIGFIRSNDNALSVLPSTLATVVLPFNPRTLFVGAGHTILISTKIPTFSWSSKGWQTFSKNFPKWVGWTRDALPVDSRLLFTFRKAAAVHFRRLKRWHLLQYLRSQSTISCSRTDSVYLNHFSGDRQHIHQRRKLSSDGLDLRKCERRKVICVRRRDASRMPIFVSQLVLSQSECGDTFPARHSQERRCTLHTWMKSLYHPARNDHWCHKLR